ncbi:MAG TPA: transglycosylase domain-containing protein, partial [Acidimicrobiales bacterium]|nr:transglycosylase domain-containing protein [Acidimicrobiales bacterium]
MLTRERSEGATEEEPPGRLWRWRRWLFAVALIFLAIIAGFLYMFSHLKLPAPRALKQATLIYDASGTHVIASFSQENRINVPLKQVPPVVINAVVSTEDRHFFSEGALNPVSIVRAAISDVTGGHLQGASTITQQYVKQAYLNPKRTLTRKIEEAFLAIRLSRSESKQKILQGYLNTIYWGRGAYGVEAASLAYFGKPVQQLGLPEASLLAALIREPELADPARSPTQARQNQDDTLNAMVRDHKITRQQADQVEAIPYSSYVIRPTASTGSKNSVAADPTGQDYFISAVRQELYQKYGRALVDGGGLRVTTTLDPAMQAQAYNSIYGKSAPLNPAKGTPSGALVSIDGSGAVKALVGGQDFGTSTVNLALGTAGGGSGRQAGSTFKAIMLAEVLREGYSVNSVFPAPRQYVVPHGNANGAPWVVTNFEGETPAPTLTLVDATVHSVNTVYAQVVTKIGADKLNSMAETLGISPKEMAGAYPSRVLGTADVSPLEMASAFATFSDGGVYHQPLLITRVTDPTGKSLPLPVKPESRVVLTPSQAA